MSPPKPSGRAPAPSTLHRVRRGRITRNTSDTANTTHAEMGQGSSAPRSGRATSTGPDAMEQDEPAQQPSSPTQPRRSRRIRSNLQQLGERIMRSGVVPDSSRSTAATGATATGSQHDATNPQLRHRVRFLASRSTSPRLEAPVATQRNGRPRSPVNNGTMESVQSPVREEQEDNDQAMSDMAEASETDQRLHSDAEAQPTVASSPVVGDTPTTSRRSRLSRVRSSLSSNLPNLLAELGNTSRFSANSSRRTSQLRNSQYDPFDLEDDMDGDDRASLGSGDAPIRSGRTGFGSLDDANAMDLLENPRVRPGEDQAAMLSRLLSVAAAMTAASLVGNSEQALTEAQDVAGDTVDGSFESFLRALQNGRLAAALRNGGNEMGGGMSADSASDGSPPLNFFRMFRFGASATDSFNANNAQGEGDTPPSRMIPVIIVGIRSVSPRETTAANTQTPENAPPFLEQLAANITSTNSPPNANRGGLRGRLAAAANRRASMGSTFTDTPRSPRRTRPVSDILSPTMTSVADTPQGPHPPPSTPAEPVLASASNAPRDTTTTNTATSTSTHRDTPRPARRHSTPHLPANGTRNEATAEGSGSRTGTGAGNERGARSWIIYVLGGSYPENHPILTTPSLFTDSPTYEDMMLLSSLLGPAKPPVASKDDIDQAGGVFTIGKPSESTAHLPTRDMPEGERCLVCLGDYEIGEVCRSLTQCSHIFHKDCIDTWLTTGRNSCPLCRGQGVQEKETATPPEQSPAAPATEAVS